MRIFPKALLIFIIISTLLENQWVLSKKPSRPPKSYSSSARQSALGSSKAGRSSATVPRRQSYEVEEMFVDEDDDDMDEIGEDFNDEDVDDFDDAYEDEEEEDDEEERAIKQPKTPVSRRVPPRKSGNRARENTMRRPPPSATTRKPHSRPFEPEDDDDVGDYRRKKPRSSKSRQEDDYYEDNYRRPPSKGRPQEEWYEENAYRSRSRSSPKSPPKSGKRRPRYPPPGRNRPPPRHRGEIEAYRPPSSGQKLVSSLSTGWSGLVNAMPDSATVRDFAKNSINKAKETTNTLSANIYREVKGLTSSELEQVMLKATKPDDTRVNSKIVERLIGVTYQVSVRYDIYDGVLRKLWSKMAERDWRTTMKALYLLHLFSADGSPAHAPALKARLRELRRTRDPKRKGKYFNTKLLLAGDSNSPETTRYRAYMSRYAHYVLLRAQCFGGMFEEISTLPKVDKKKTKPITSTCLRAEHLDAAVVLFKAGMDCQLKKGEECENCAVATERVASDMIGLTTGVAVALNRALKDDDLKGADPILLKKWCVLYSEELLPKTRAMVKKTSPKLDPYGLFLPSRMGTTVPRDILEKGLRLGEETTEPQEEEAGVVSSSTQDEEEESEKKMRTDATSPKVASQEDDEAEEQEQEEDAEEEDAGNEERESEEDGIAGEEELDAPDGEDQENGEEDDEYDYEYEEEEYFEDEED